MMPQCPQNIYNISRQIRVIRAGYRRRANERDFLFLSLVYNRGLILKEALKAIGIAWSKYYRRSDVDFPIKFDKEYGIKKFESMNKAFDVPLYTDEEVRYRFFYPLIDHSFFICNKINWNFFKEISHDLNLKRYVSTINAYVNKYKATQAEISLYIISICMENEIPVPEGAIRTFIYNWGKYYQRSDLAEKHGSKIANKKVKSFKNMNEAFAIPNHTKGRIKKEVYAPLVYSTLASLKSHGITMDEIAHEFIGYKHNLSRGTSKNYYTYMLEKGAPSVSGRAKRTNKGSGLNIEFFQDSEDLKAYQEFKKALNNL